MSEIANPIIKAKHQFAILCEFFRFWVFMDTIDGRNGTLLKLTCDGLVCRQHEFFNELVRFIVLDALQFYRPPVFIEPDFCLWKIKIEPTMLESFPPQK